MGLTTQTTAYVPLLQLLINPLNTILNSLIELAGHACIVSVSSNIQLQPLQLQPAAPSIDQSDSSALRGGGEGMRCLLVRHLPSWLNREEKESLFSHFGAQDVIIMPNKGKMVCMLCYNYLV